MPRFGSAILLAGGKSRRMGFDKQTLETHGEPLPHALIRRLQGCFDDIIVATNDVAFYAALPVRTVSDRYPGRGPMAGIEAGLRAAGSDFVYVLACDMPFYDAAFSDALRQKLSASPNAEIDGIITCLADGRIEPFNAFYGKHLAADMAHCLEAGYPSLTQFCRDRHMLCLTEAEARVVSPDLAVFRNLNRPDDLAGLAGIASPADSRNRLTKAESALVKPVEVVRVTGDLSQHLTDTAIDEATITIVVLESADVVKEPQSPAVRFSASFSVLAERLDDFVRGYLLSAGRVRSLSGINSIEIRPAGDDGENEWQAAVRLHAGACGDSLRNESPLEQRFVTPDLPFPADRLFHLFAELDGAGHLFHLTGGTHVLALADKEGRLLDIVQDVSRHVALDKLIGKAAFLQRSFADLVLLASCRLTASIVDKAIAVGLPVLASRAAVTTLAVTRARAHHIRLIGFVRGGRFNIYL